MARISQKRRSAIVDNSRTVRYQNFGGIDISSSNDTISDFNTPDSRNMLPNNKGDLTARFGVEVVHDFGLDFGEKPINGWTYKTGAVIHNGLTFYYWDGTTMNDLSVVPSGSNYTAFEYNSKLYILGEGNFYEFDGTTLSAVTPYIPTVLINSPSGGGGTELEEENRISDEQAQEFQFLAGDTVATYYQQNLTSAKVYYLNATTGDWDLKTLGVDYSENLVTGVFTYINFPPTSLSQDGNDTVRIIGNKPNATAKNSILECKISVVYGGKSRVSVWVSGNTDFPNFDFHSGITKDGNTDPTYFPTNEFDEIGFDDQSIIAYGVQNDELVIYKYNSETKRESTWLRTTQVTGSTVNFFIQELNSGRGCVAPESVVLVNNQIWALSNDGYGKIVPRQVLAENNIEIVSDYINYNRNTTFSSVIGLLETQLPSDDLSDVSAIDYQGKLYVSKVYSGEDYVWVCDYDTILLDNTTGKYLPQWYLLNNILADKWLLIDGVLHFLTRDGGLKKFKDNDSSIPFEDDQLGDVPNPALPSKYDFFWTTKLTNLGTIQYKEDVESIYLAMQGYSDTTLNVWTRSDVDANYVLKDTHNIKSLVYSGWTYSTFVYGGTLFPRAFRTRVKLRNVEYVQVKIGGTTGLPATLTSVEMNVSEGKEVR